MAYIPRTLLKHKENMQKVHAILDKMQETDLIVENQYDLNKAIKDLEKINEQVIIEKLKEGFFNN